MALFVTRYELDRTGINPANRIAGEEHPFTAADTTLIVPKFGYFYKDNLVIKNLYTGLPLTAGQYICTEYFEKASLTYGKAIYGSILITDDSLNGVILDYNVLGGENTRSPSNILSVFEERMQPNLAVPWDDLTDKPKEFPPTKDHFHNLSEVHDLIRIFKYIDDIRDAILVGHMPAYNALLDYIDNALAGMENTMRFRLTELMPGIVDAFKAQFTKLFFGLDKLVNLACATNQEARNASGINFKQADIVINKYMVLSALVSFKEGIYLGIVNKLTTNIGTYDQKFISPLKTSLFNMENGANASFIGLEKAQGNGIDFDQDIYPNSSRGLDSLVVNKISNGVGHRGGVFHVFDQADDLIHLGGHITGEIAQDFAWKTYLIEGDVAAYLDTIIKHIQDTGNPHQLTKQQIHLGLVENLPVVTKDNILNMTSAREYLTMDTLLYFMRAFLQQNAWHVELPEGHRNRFLLDNCQVVFSPCGGCGCSDRSDFQPVTTEPPVTCPAANTLLRTFCSDSPDNEPESGSDAEPTGFNKYGVYTDGDCGEEVRLIEANSPDCGWVPPSELRASIEIRDMHNRLIGMGYGPSDTKDPNATVEMRSAAGTLICNIYPRSGDGYDSAILDGDGSFIGFAVNP